MSKLKAVKLEEQLERDLIESKNLFKIVFERSPAAIMVADSRQRIVAWNPMAEKMLGMGKADLFNKPVSILYPAQRVEAHACFDHTPSRDAFQYR